ncbi:GMC family oxidoreductase [Virgifigura deserti]|uniref:GMC family oxidoreductase n=1 Tax=Virgifigura deserti TaxID=2268457 RepID=UPI003CCBB4FC
MEADYIVVGAGTAGCVLAARLSENPDAEVVLLDAGGEITDPDVRDPLKWPALQGRAYDWGYATTAQDHCAGRSHAWPRGRGLGGSTLINAMAHVRGHPEDFDRWARAGCAGWGYADLLPYFIKSESSSHGPSPYHGTDGPIHLIQPETPHPITQAYMRAGTLCGLEPTAEHNGARMTGPTVNTLTIKDGKRQTVADAYLTAEVKARPNLSVLSGVMVDSVVLASGGGGCRGVRILTAAGIEEIWANAGVILCAGAIGSPSILMRSGLGPADELTALDIACRQDMPGVGRNLHDHLLAGGNVYRSKRPVAPSRYQHSESLCYIDGAGPTAAPEIVLACVVAPITTECFSAPPPGEGYTIMYGFTHPRSRGTVRLASADVRAAPLIDPGYLREDYDRRIYKEALDWARTVGASAALDDWRAEEVLPGAEDLASPQAVESFLERAAYTHHHPVGTCRMGTDAEAVVGPDLAVRNIAGLYVMDASVMPSITTGPVNAAIIAMAERAGDLISSRRPLAPMAPAAARQAGV